MRSEESLRQSADAADLCVLFVGEGMGGWPRNQFVTTPIYGSSSTDFQLILSLFVFIVAMTQLKWTIVFVFFFENSVGAYMSRLTIWKVFLWKSMILERPQRPRKP